MGYAGSNTGDLCQDKLDETVDHRRDHVYRAVLAADTPRLHQNAAGDQVFDVFSRDLEATNWPEADAEQKERSAPPDTLPIAVWAYLMENAQTVVVTLTIVALIVVIVPPMVNSQRAAHDTIAQSCARALQSALAQGEYGQDLSSTLAIG